MTEEHGPDVVKWFTRARKFPQMIGRTPDGAKLPGGPYTVTQAVAAGVILVVGLNTMSLWARFGLLGNMLLLATVTAVVVWSLGRIPVGSRSPISVASGLVQAVMAPTHGRLAGHAVRIPRPSQLQHRVVFAVDPNSDHTVTGPIEVTPPTRAGNDVDAQPRPPAKIRRLPRPSLPALPRVRVTRPEKTSIVTAPAAQTPAEPRADVPAPEYAAAAVSSQQRPTRAPLTGVQALLASGTRTAVNTATPTLTEETDR